MVKITLQKDTINVSGSTYKHRLAIKELGGRWNGEKKIWLVPNTSENHKKLTGMKQTRSCGWCGEVGHFKPKCPLYLESARKCALVEAERNRDNPGYLYKKFAGTRHDCECRIVDRHIEELDMTVQEPVICWGCKNYCCSEVVVCDIMRGYLSTERNFTCPMHLGTYQEREVQKFLNDTRGT